MPWYDGPSLLHHLENVHVASDRNLIDARFPVQYVIRPQSDAYHDYRGYAGTVAGGVLKPGDDVVVLPSGLPSRIASIDTADGPVDEAFAPMAVTIRLEDDIDVSRGDMICRPHNAPTPVQDVDAMVCWMSETPLRPGQKLAVKHTTRTARVLVKDLQYRLDVNSLHRDETRDLARAQRHRPRAHAHDAAAVHGPVQPQPRHRRLRPHRREHQPHGRGRHGHLDVTRGGARALRLQPRPGAGPARAYALMVCSSGGHLAQLVALRPWYSAYRTRWVTFPTTDAT